MELIPLSKIKIQSDRFRQEFKQEELDELATSIARLGLIHPIVVRRTKDQETGGFTFTLVAGERRLRAVTALHEKGVTIPLGHAFQGIKEVPSNYIPALSIAEVGEHAEKEIELDENTRRSNLTWQEVAKATKLLHDLRTAADPDWTIAKTGEEMAARGQAGFDQTRTKHRIALAEHLETVPGLAKASTEREAFKALSNALEQQLRAAMLEKQQTHISMGDNRLVAKHMSCTEGMSELEPGSVDVIITDPPYGVDADKFGVESVMKTHEYLDTKAHAFDLIEEMAKLSVVVCKPKAHMYLFHTIEFFFELKEIIEFFGWEVWPRPLIWVKNTGYTPKADLGPRYHYECILYANRGKRNVLTTSTDVLVYGSVPPNDRVHAAQKPAALYRDLMRRSAIPNDLVIDPFCGSGPLLRAAKTENVRAIGFDIDAANIQLCYDLLEKDL